MLNPITTINRTDDALRLAQEVRKKRVSPEELVEESFRIIQQWNPSLNAVIHPRKEKALKEAAERDFSDKPFGGVPILVKDAGHTLKGEPSTSGSRLLKNHVAQQTSCFTKKLEEAGFVVIGQSNVPEFSFTNVTNSELYQPALNPWDTTRSPGGSSGGAAAAVASGMVPVASASDGGGSIRIPASFTGLVGLKPTRGRTPVGPGSGRDWQGAAVSFGLTKSIRDTAALLDVLQVVQQGAAFQTPLFEKGYSSLLHEEKTRPFRIAYTLESPVGSPVSEEAEEAVKQAIRWFEQKGYPVEEAAPPVDGVELMRSYYVMNSGETAAMMGNIEKRLGRKLAFDDMELITWVLFNAGKKLSAADYSNTFSVWDYAAYQMAQFHETYDLLLAPATGEVAPLVDREYRSPELKERMRNIQEYTAAEQQEIVWDMFDESLAVTPFTQQANLTGQPAISLPTYKSADGLPLGIQLTAPKGREDWLLLIGHEMEQDGLFV